MPGFPIHHQLPELGQPYVHRVGDVIQPSHPPSSPSPASVFPSIRVYSNESVLCIRWPKDCSFSFSISPSKEYSGLISLRIDWFDLLAGPGTLKSLQQQQQKKESSTPQFKRQWTKRWTQLMVWLVKFLMSQLLPNCRLAWGLEAGGQLHYSPASPRSGHRRNYCCCCIKQEGAGWRE